MPIEPFIPGTVYGVIMNLRAEIEALGEALSAPPYGSPPEAPVLYIKPPNTFLPGGGEVAVPAGSDALEMGASIALVFGRTAARVGEDEALDFVAGYAPVIDVSIPHASLHRPAIRQRCRDRFLPIGALAPKSAVADLNQLSVAVRINGAEAGGFSTAELVRPIPRLIADVTDFMTLGAGDVLLVGLPPQRPLARLGDRAEAEVAGVGTVGCTLVTEGKSRSPPFGGSKGEAREGGSAGGAPQPPSRPSGGLPPEGEDLVRA
jgi:5-oxopent-3-ene-1,2,5-tricarboxylate decarboxylase/2-hydroxyhepta-2,4-diene-1,7-dioate isomerase